MAQDAPNERHELQPAQDALVTGEVPKSGHRMQPSRPQQDALAREEAARPKGLFPSYPRRSGREARGLHDMPTALHLREG